MTSKDKMIFNEEELLAGLKVQDQEAFTIIYNTYAPKLFRYAVKIIKSTEIAEDAVHDIFVKLWNNAPLVNIESSIQSYLYKLTQNHLLNLIKRETVQERYIDEIMFCAEQFSENTENTIAYRETMEKAQQAIDNLPPQRKLIFEMGRNGGMSHREIARELDIADSTVNNQIVKALRSIKDHLIANGVISLFLVVIILLKK
ncbi:RNA polymerase sigma-70 factor [Mucilaginibacter sp. SP1R1]|uniref:RNA polymerase sigma-70 factor n=1 Tax=Mucilaginibacter sp. SP1R1 TaxID=2723091 RepID=UPI001612E560|nr:RNA polymerase sigma-70 factor [Mucilaginibacter sp. SP1R1]MBB6149983.1 RNA polymerase sigma-70 factor (ECF subfamily) [Mucilaginibacter sp. SP1R1]